MILKSLRLSLLPNRLSDDIKNLRKTFYDIKLVLETKDGGRKCSVYKLSQNKAIDTPFSVIPYNDNSFSKLSHDEVIVDAIKRIEGLGFIKELIGEYRYQITKDPFEDDVKRRVYGFDPYELNNGALIYIQWYDPTELVDSNGVRWGKLVGGTEWDGGSGVEKESVGGIERKSLKKIVLIVGKDDRVLDTIETYTFINNNEIVINTNTTNKYEFSGSIEDKKIIENIVQIWSKKYKDYNLVLGKEPSLEYKSPVVVTDKERAEIKTPKRKMDIMVNTSKTIHTKEDIGLLRVYLNDGFAFGTQQEIEVLDDEYLEDDLQAEYASYDFEQISQLQIEIPETEPDLKFTDLQPAGNLDDIFRKAAEYAKAAGRPSLDYNQFRSRVSKGLCAIGARCIASAMLGSKSIASISGHADAFSFKTVPTGGLRHSDLSKSGFYNYKVRIGQEYLKNRAMWQVGDIVAWGYISSPYGHIQTWTGHGWCCDFRQSTISLPQKGEKDSIALWRLNENGIARIQELNGDKLF